MNKALTLALVFVALAGTIFYMAPKQGNHITHSKHVLNFKSWKTQHNKTYATDEEEQMRFQIFKNNFGEIVRKNQDPNSGVYLGLNQFADLTLEEFKQKHLNLTVVRNPNVTLHKPSRKDVPASINWVTKGAVTPIKNQGQSGSAFSFAAVGALEGASFVHQNKIEALSTAEITDCVKDPFPTTAVFDFTKLNGIQTAASYPSVTGKCQADPSQAYYKNTDSKAVPQNDNDALKEAVAQQPVMVAIDGTSLMFYSSGVLRAKDCTQTVNHAVVIVGYDNLSGVDYWLIKNSWGASWGENGYAKIERTSGKQAGACGISLYPLYPYGASQKRKVDEEVEDLSLFD